MNPNDLGIQLQYASVDSGDGRDPRPEAIQILGGLRVPAGLRDADLEWSGDDAEAVLTIPVTDGNRVLTLTDTDAIEATVAPRELREAFKARGLTLWLDDEADSSEEDRFDDDDDADDDDADDVDEAVAIDEDEDEDFDEDESAVFAPEPVRVAAFSHRGPVWARVAAELHRTQVAHVESGEWSLQLFQSTEPSKEGVALSKAESPVVEWNRPTTGGAWFEVSTAGAAFPVPFWVDAERGTRPVLDIDAISDEQTVAVYRRLLTEGDGSRAELEELSRRVQVDVDAAHRALMPEALGGIVGADEREHEFLLAFGIPAELIETARTENAGSAQVFEAAGWGAALAGTLVAGTAEWAPLTRRGTPAQRFTRWIAQRPLLGIAIAVAESAAGFWAARRLRGVGRGLGIMLVIDALGDLAIWIVRLRRRS